VFYEGRYISGTEWLRPAVVILSEPKCDVARRTYPPPPLCLYVDSENQNPLRVKLFLRVVTPVCCLMFESIVWWFGGYSKAGVSG
jgi:hypothetical protein